MPETRLDHSITDSMAKRNLTLAGFTLTALSIMVGFYEENLSGASAAILSLFVAMVVFFLGSQFGYDAEHVWEARLADVFQYIGIIFLLFSFMPFIFENFQYSVVSLLILGLGLFVIAVYLIRIVSRIFSSSKRIAKENGDTEQKRSGQTD